MVSGSSVRNMNMPVFASIEALCRRNRPACPRTAVPRRREGPLSHPVLSPRRGLVFDERGSVTVEVMLWLPVFVELLLLSFDVFWAFWLNAEMWNVAYGAVREVTRGNFDILLVQTDMESIVRQWVQAQLGSGYAVSYLETATHHVVTVDADVDRMSVFGNLSDVLPSVSASVTMAKEP